MSLNDERQIVLVGMAQDFGVCAGMNRSKRDGRFCECRCEHPIDLRMGLYCKTHQKQQFQKEGGSGSSKKTNTTFMQQLRTENAPATNNTLKRGQIVQNKQGVYVNTATPNASLQRRNVQRGGFGGSMTGSSLATLAPGTMTISTPAGTVVTHVPTKNGSQQLQTPQRSNSLRAPLHMTKQSNKSSVTMIDRNPYKKAASRNPSRGMMLSTTKLPSVQKGRNSTQVNMNDLLGSAISGSGKRNSVTPNDKSRGITSIAGSSSEKKKRRVAHLEGFDGAVFVPKPSPLFRMSQLSGGPNISDSTNSFTAQDSSEQTKERLIEHQRMVAERIRQNAGAIGNASRTPLSKLTNRTTNQGHNKQQNSVTKERKSGLDSIIGTFKESEKNKVMSTKSRFSSEADAERYLESRKAVTELENREGRADLQSKTKEAKSLQKAIVTQWVCDTCHIRTTKMPNICMRAGHRLRRERELTKTSTLTETRLGKQKKSTQDGGLTLGSGVEWSDWRK
jgi:minichromosome maintenance protein 10